MGSEYDQDHWTVMSRAELRFGDGGATCLVVTSTEMLTGVEVRITAPLDSDSDKAQQVFLAACSVGDSIPDLLLTGLEQVRSGGANASQ